MQDIENLKEEFIHMMRLLHREQFHPIWTSGKVSKPEMHTLMCVWAVQSHQKEARPSALAKYSQVSPSAISQTLKTLEEKELVKRVRSEKDSRSVVIALTEKGRTFVNEIQEIRSRYFNEMFEVIGVDDMRALIRITRRVLDFCESKHDAYGSKIMIDNAANEEMSDMPSKQSAGEVLPCE